METKPQETLGEAAWREDGHASDVALDVLADGEAGLLPRETLAHVERCADCSDRLGAAALLSMGATAVLREVAPKPARSEVFALPPLSASPASARARRSPKAAIVVALLVAVVSALPAVLGVLTHLPETKSAIARGAPVIMRVAFAAIQMAMRGKARPEATIVWWVATICLCAIGAQVARRATRVRALEGGS